MPAMTDPMAALISFDRELKRGMLEIQPCQTDTNLFVHLDQPTGKPRFTYVRLDGKTVTAMAIFALVEPIDRVQCFHMGYAVAEDFRGQGRGKEIAAAAMKELASGFSRTPIAQLKRLLARTTRPLTRSQRRCCQACRHRSLTKSPASPHFSIYAR